MNGAGQTYDRNFIDDPLAGVSTPGSTLANGFRADVSTWALLAAVPTFGAVLPAQIEWFDPILGLTRSTILLESTAPTDNANGTQRPNDYDAVNNAVCWFQIGFAG